MRRGGEERLAFTYAAFKEDRQSWPPVTMQWQDREGGPNAFSSLNPYFLTLLILPHTPPACQSQSQTGQTRLGWRE